jgi:hypothetical protein
MEAAISNCNIVIFEYDIFTLKAIGGSLWENHGIERPDASPSRTHNVK